MCCNSIEALRQWHGLLKPDPFDLKALFSGDASRVLKHAFDIPVAGLRKHGHLRQLGLLYCFELHLCSFITPIQQIGFSTAFRRISQLD